MSAAINVEDVTRDRRDIGQVHDRIRDVLDRRGQPIGDRLSLTFPVKRRVDRAGRDRVHAVAVLGSAMDGLLR